VIAETELVKARSGAFVQEEGTMFHYVAPPDVAPVPGEFNAMKWTRLLFSIVAIGLFASIGAVYVHSAASSGVVDQSAAVLVLSLIGSIAGYYFVTHHFGSEQTL
jgi:hypothetical protein